MSKELVISSNRHETKVAILEDDQLVEIYFQRANEYSLAGSVHKGRVTRVLPGMQSAFVDLGLERDTFLYVSDFFEENEDYDPIPVGREERREPADRTEREEKSERLEPSPVEPAAAAFPVTEPIPSRPPSPPPLPESAPAVDKVNAGPPTERPPDRQDDGDRRGRRSRRRRNRGRGFPDSKYASEVGETSKPPEPSYTAHAPHIPPAPRIAPEPAQSSDFAVLPGESLAKYSRPAGEPQDEEPEAPSLPEVHPEPIQAASVAPAPVEEPVIAHLEALASPVEVAHEAPPVEPEAEPLRLAAAPAQLELPENDLAEADDEAEADTQPAGVDLIELIELDGSEVGSIADPEEEEEGEGPEEAEGVSEEDLELPFPMPPQGPPAPLTAQVREPGGRYMHRQSRRMRRRGRGGPGPESAPPPNPAPRSEPRPETRTAALPRPERVESTSIAELLKQGQEIIVQIAKEPLGQKGARITSHIALPGRYVVYMPTVEHMGVSRKIASDEERQRLKRIVQNVRGIHPGGFIVRTAGEGKPEEEILADMSFLANLWLDMKQKAEKRPAPVLLHHDLDIVERILRDQVSDTFKSIWVDSEEVYENILRFTQRFQPALVSKVKLYTRSAPIFDAFNISQELEKALRPKVWLKSGGYIVINQTEALVAIDVNTGKYVGRSNRLEDTIVKTNTEAVKEIVRQIRLRDLGGIIVVDFIDMDERKNRQKVMQVLEDAMRVDKAPYKILQFNDFGLVAITRKRVKQSLERALCSPCPYCEGAGSVKSVQTTVGEILQEAHKIAKAVEGKDVMLRVHPEVAKFLKSNQNRYLEELEEVLKRPVLVKGDPLLHQEKYDLA